MAARVPDIAASKKLLLFDAVYLNQPEVTMDGENVTIDEAIEVAVLTGAPFVSLEMDEFNPKDLLAEVLENVPEDAPSAENLKGLIGGAAKHKGESERLWLCWAAQGLSYEWSATADWRRKLAVDLARVRFEGQQLTANQERARKTDMDALVTLLIESPEVRAAQPTKRHPIGHAVISNTGYEEDEGVIIRACSEANILVGRRAQELELSLKPRLNELAEEFRKTPEWKAATSNPKRQAAADAFLIGKADGYRLSGNIMNPLIDAAKALDNSMANKITFTPR